MNILKQLLRVSRYVQTSQWQKFTFAACYWFLDINKTSRRILKYTAIKSATSFLAFSSRSNMLRSILDIWTNQLEKNCQQLENNFQQQKKSKTLFYRLTRAWWPAKRIFLCQKTFYGLCHVSLFSRRVFLIKRNFDVSIAWACTNRERDREAYGNFIDRAFMSPLNAFLRELRNLDSPLGNLSRAKGRTTARWVASRIRMMMSLRFLTKLFLKSSENR